MKIESVQHLDFEGQTTYYTLRDSDGCYVGTFSDHTDLWDAIEELGDEAYSVLGWSILKGMTIYGNDLKEEN